MKYYFKAFSKYKYNNSNIYQVLDLEEIDDEIKVDDNNLPKAITGYVTHEIEVESESFNDALKIASVDHCVILLNHKASHNDICFETESKFDEVKVRVNNKWISVNDVCDDCLNGRCDKHKLH